MIEVLDNAWIAVDETLGAIPAPLLILMVLALAALAATALFGALVVVLRRFVKPHHPLFWSYLRRTSQPIRFAFILVGLSAAVRLLPIEPGHADAIGRGLQLGVIVLAGWLVYVAAGMASDVYLLRFRIDVPDNLLARKHVTQIRVLSGALKVLVAIITVAAALMTFESVRQYGVSLFASAGIAGIVVGLAARPLLSNLIAGIQIAMTQPIRIDDAVVIENEWGWVEEITATYVVIKLWDWRRLIVPLSYFMEKPFQNWTRSTASIIGSVVVHLDYGVPVARVREALEDIVRASPLWDATVVNLQVVDAHERTVELRALVSARTSPQAWDLRCEVREKLIAFVQREYPQSLPRTRAEIGIARAQPAETAARAKRNGERDEQAA